MDHEKKSYYLGLDIGTDSVGYAVTNCTYDLIKFRGEPVWGATTFEAASLAKERRMNRTSRRRLDRRQQRVQLLSEIFAPEICAVDANFFIRRKESALFMEDTQYGVKLFDGGITDQEYHKQYPTIHHLIVDLMQSASSRDIRLVYLACAWLVANRGHFLLDVANDRIRDFSVPYTAFTEYLTDCGYMLPWADDTAPETVLSVMQEQTGVTRKKALFAQKLYGVKKLPNKTDEAFPFRRDVIVTLLSGGKAAPKDLFDNDSYAEVESVSLDMDEDNFDRILADLGDDGMLLRLLRGMYDCALLNRTLRGYSSISEAKVAVYNQHAKDLKWLKYFIRKYKKEEYAKVFRRAEKGLANYTAYSYNLKNCTPPQTLKKAGKDDFSDFLLKIVKDVSVTQEDQSRYEDMLNRLSDRTFLPKQKDGDNRIIPQQLYRSELAEILRRAKAYLPMLSEADADGITNEEKILSVFDFRIPYFVGPLNQHSDHAWLERKAGKIYPWNFERMVNLDASEQRFIQQMTNTCTYLPGEDVLPYCSLLYSRFMVLNELNNLKINGNSIPVAIKQELFNNLYMNSPKKITSNTIAGYLKCHGYMNPTDEISGMDENAYASLKSYHSFKRLLDAKALTQEQVEEIINHAAFSEDRPRMARWLEREYPALSPEDQKYILRLRLKEFGRLSRRFLTGIIGTAKTTGEAFTIMEALWQTNDNLMQLLSDRYTFREVIDDFARDYYADSDHSKNLSDRLSDMYISNAVQRPIIRTLDIAGDVVKAMGCAPEKIFVEMARGSMSDQKGKRTVTRKQQILELYKKVKSEDVPHLMKELEAMGDMADNRLQSDRLFLYYMQLDKCMYTGQAIDLSQLAAKTYDIDHIYPRSKVHDDSVLNNKVLVLSSANGVKSDRYPIDESVRAKMTAFWSHLKCAGLITDEKFRRLTRATGFTENELHQFINRQLVETRQSTKAVARLLQERYPDAKIVYVKAGLVSGFRQAFDMLKCRNVNDLHHAKDAYLNIVVGNVYHEKFTSRWFDTTQEYNISVEKIFKSEQQPYGSLVWRGKSDLAKVRKTMGKNAVHLTRYAFCRKGGLFDQLPLKAGEGLTPRKKGLPTEKYGGYNKPTASFYLLASYRIKGKKDIMFVPVELRFADMTNAAQYAAGVISQINGGKTVTDVQVLLNERPIKIDSVLSLDGMLVTICGKSNKGANIIVAPLSPLVLGFEWERYIKRLDTFAEKKKANAGIQLDETHDCISAASNCALFDILTKKLTQTIFAHCPGSFGKKMEQGRERFAECSVQEQVDCLLGILAWFGPASTCDLTMIGGEAKSGAKVPSSKLSALGKSFKDIRIIDMSASSLFSSQSENLLELL